MSLKSLTLVVASLLALSACSSTPSDQGAGSGAGGAGAGAGTQIVPGSDRDFIVNVGDRVFFDFDKYNIRNDQRAQLEKQAAWLKRYPAVMVTIEGHADERGTREYNFALGARRAQAVRDYLASKGISSSRLKTTSFGKERPVAVCDDISCWSQNRRGVTVLGGQSGN